MQELIRVYNNAMRPELCDSIIAYYDDNEKVQRDDKLMKFGEVSLADSPYFNEIASLMQAAYLNYKKDTPNCLYPEEVSYEMPRVKRYEPNEGYFDWHTDVSHLESGKRMLVLFWYLNTVHEGGHTEFLINNSVARVKPFKGSVACFPPYFMFPHRGAVPISGPKYVISSYINLY